MWHMNESVVHIKYKEKDIYLVKTAHVSADSVKDVYDTYEEIHPDTICIELDKDRYDRLNDKNHWRNTNIKTVIKSGKVGMLLVTMVLASFQRRMADKMDTSSGGEMIAGINIAKENGINLVLADRNINITFKRIWNSLGLWEKCKLLTTLILSVFEDEAISEEELNQLKQSDMLDAALSEVGKTFPGVKRILVDERDMYLAQMIKTANGNKIMAIIGAAHASGICHHINEDIDLDALCDTTKRKSILGTILKWGIPLALIAIIIYSFFVSFDTGRDQLLSWIIFCGLGSGIGAILGLAHPLTILVAIVVAPFTAIHPLLAAGWFAGLIEATIRKPKVQDFEDMAEDTSSLKGFYKNKVTRILLIVVLCNVFCSIGSIIAGLDVIRSFIGLLEETRKLKTDPPFLIRKPSSYN